MKQLDSAVNQTLIILFVLMLAATTVLLGCAEPTATITPNTEVPIHTGRPVSVQPSPVLVCLKGGMVVTLNGVDTLVCFDVDNKIKTNCKGDSK